MKHTWTVKPITFLLLTALMLGWAAVPATSAPTATLTVNNTLDLSDETPGDGVCDTSSITPGDQCGLRAAIEELNAQGPDISPHRIEFNISGTGPFIITPAVALPAITVPVEILGVTQPGTTCPGPSAPAILQIVLDGSSAGTGASGLILESGSDSSTVRGLVIGNFDHSGVKIYSNSNIVRCTYIGLGADGLTDMGNGLMGIFIASDSNIIGGQNAFAQRNVISNNDQGIYIQGGTGNIIRNNYIGTTADGMSASGNGIGIYILGDSNTIGGSAALAGNLISGNAGPGTRLNNAQLNIVQGNTIGVASDGTTPLPNSETGIEGFGASISNTIGGTAPGQANRIGYNGGDGIILSRTIGGIPIQNEIRGNTIYDNTILGIDLGGNGVDSNDPGDIDGGENQHQNYPVLQATVESLVITGTLDSQANTQYSLDLYRNNSCDPSGYGEGQEHIFEGSVTTDATGHTEFSLNLVGLASSGDGITSTATDPNGNTSEFSACVTISLPPTPTLTVTVTPITTSTPTPSLTPIDTATPGPSPTVTNTPVISSTPSPDGTPSADLQIYLPFILR